ncbi:MAG: hypothetical protein K8T25_17050, partial [Planctomycetia bacterium]|nr:hypothetical protein [Planctomycetia bacterium]
RAGVRHISVYNQLGEEELMERIKPESEEERQSIPLHLPYIICIADEIADLMMTAPKEVESHIIRLAQKSRAVGIHLVLATQKPTVDVITGLIKSNLPARIAFQVASRVDSRVVLDEMGADKLLGNGDRLFLWPGTSTLLRGQGTYLSDDEITKVIGAVATTEPDYVGELVQLQPANAAGGGESQGTNRFKNRDDMYEAAIDVIVREGRGSVSLLQRALGIGYGRGARLIDFMAEDGIVGTYNGSQAREVLVTPEQWAQMQAEANGTAPPAVLAPAPPRRNKIEVTPRRPSPLEEDEFATAEEAESQIAAAAKSRRTVRPSDEDEESEEEIEEDESEYGIRPPVEISRGDDDPDELGESEAEELDEDDQHLSDWHEDEIDEADETADEDEVEEYAELDEEEESEPINAPRPSAGKIEASKPSRGKGRQSRSA